MTMIARACPLCGSEERSQVVAEETYQPAKLDTFAFASRKLPEYMHYRLLRCAECDVVYASPAPPPEALAEAYRAADFDSGRESRYAARTYARLARRIAAGFPDRVGALDIGAGDGAFLAELLAAGFTEVIGVEPSAAPLAAAADAVRPLIRHGLFRAEDFPGRQFRLITCFQTLEHVPDPLGLCRAARAMLKPGGAMLGVVHNRRAWSARLLGRKSPIYDIEHLQLFCPRSARRLFATAGFRDVRTMAICNRYPLAYWMRLFPLPAKLKRAAIAAAGAVAMGRLPVSLPAGNLAVVGFRE